MSYPVGSLQQRSPKSQQHNFKTVPNHPPKVGIPNTAAIAAFWTIETSTGFDSALRHERLLGHFALPDAAWWENYYNPLEARLPELRSRYESDEEALAVIQMTEAEIVLRRKFPDAYG